MHGWTEQMGRRDPRDNGEGIDCNWLDTAEQVRETVMFELWWSSKAVHNFKRKDAYETLC